MSQSSNHPINQAEHFSGPPPVCKVCEEAAVGVGPYSQHYLCQTHLDIDVTQVRQLKFEVNEKLKAYAGVKAAAITTEKLKITNKLQDNAQKYALMMQLVNDWHDLTTNQLTSRLQAVEKCVLDCDDVTSYKTEVDEAETSGNMVGVFDLAISMQASLPDLAADFERAQCLRVEKDESEVGCLQKLQQVVAGALMDAETANSLLTDQPVTSDAEPSVDNTAITDVERQLVHTADRAVTPIASVSHELKLDSCPVWVAVCSDTSEFRGDPRSGRVVPAVSAGDDSVTLPQLCLIVTYLSTDHITVLSLDGAVKLCSYCSEVQWNQIVGLRCDRHFVFIAQDSAVTMMDISGRVIHQILPKSAGFDRFSGIGTSKETDNVFVSSLNKIAAFSKATGQLQSVIALSQLPDARLGNLAIDDKNRLFVLYKSMHLLLVRTDSHQLIANYPTKYLAMDVAVDNRGCVFYSEQLNHRVCAIAADGSELWTLGVSGSINCKLKVPWGLAVVTLETQEQLVVADTGNQRLLVLNLH